LKGKIRLHFKLTSSQRALSILNNWDTEKNKFIKIFPKELKAILSKGDHKTSFA